MAYKQTNRKPVKLCALATSVGVSERDIMKRFVKDMKSEDCMLSLADANATILTSFNGLFKILKSERLNENICDIIKENLDVLRDKYDNLIIDCIRRIAWIEERLNAKPVAA